MFVIIYVLKALVAGFKKIERVFFLQGETTFMTFCSLPLTTESLLKWGYSEKKEFSIRHFYAHTTKWGGAYNFTFVFTSFCMSVCQSITLCSSVLFSAAPHTVFDAEI